MSICRLDTFLVILNMEEEKIVRVYHADTYRFLGAFLEKGRGSDEVITCRKIWAAPWKGKMRLWLQAPLNFVGVVDLESSLETGKPCWEQQYKLGRYVKSDHLYRSVFPLNDSVFWISCAEEPSWFYPEGTLKKIRMVVIPLFLKKGCRVFLRKTCIGWNSITLLLRHKILFGIRLIPIYSISTGFFQPKRRCHRISIRLSWLFG